MTIDLTTFEIILAVLFAVVTVLIALRTGGPQKADETLVAQLERVQKEREYMDRLERSYRDASATQQRVIDVLAGTLNTLAPAIPGKADSAVAALLQDIRTPGAPPAHVPTEDNPTLVDIRDTTGGVREPEPRG
jgi:hypothetical protein